MIKKIYVMLVCLLGVSGLNGMEEVKKPKIGYVEKLDKDACKLTLPNDFTLEKHQCSKDGNRTVFYHDGWIYSFTKDEVERRYVKDKPLAEPSIGDDNNCLWVSASGEVFNGFELQATVTDYARLESLEVRGDILYIYLKNREEVRWLHYKRHEERKGEFATFTEGTDGTCLALFSKETLEKAPLPASFNEWFEIKSYKWHYLGVATFAAAVIGGGYYLWQKKKAEKSKRAENNESAELEEQAAETVVG